MCNVKKYKYEICCGVKPFNLTFYNDNTMHAFDILVY